jgi:hypothetical protein
MREESDFLGTTEKRTLGRGRKNNSTLKDYFYKMKMTWW